MNQASTSWKQKLRQKLLPSIQTELVLWLFMLLVFHLHYFGARHIIHTKVIDIHPNILFVLLWGYGLLILFFNVVSYGEYKKSIESPKGSKQEADPIAWLLLLGSLFGHMLLAKGMVEGIKQPSPVNLMMLFYAVAQGILSLYYLYSPPANLKASQWKASWLKVGLMLTLVISGTLLLDNLFVWEPIALTTTMLALGHGTLELIRRWGQYKATAAD